jgi:hypothetical protein
MPSSDVQTPQTGQIWRRDIVVDLVEITVIRQVNNVKLLTDAQIPCAA